MPDATSRLDGGGGVPFELSLEDIRLAAERIAPYVVRTPLERSAWLSGVCGAEVWLKLECFQRTGSFKLRGALNALLALGPSERAKGVVTASAGNHGLGLARAAELLGVAATVVVPETASPAKVEALRASGCELRQEGRDYDGAERFGLRLAETTGAIFVSAYNDGHVMAGGGTVALEVLDELLEVEALLVPAGGGGLISGVGVAAKGRRPGVAVYGVQSVASPALRASVLAGRVVEVTVAESLADGLAGNLQTGSLTVEVTRRHVEEIALVEESEIEQAMRELLYREQVVAEGSAAVGVAALLAGRLRPAAGPVAVLVTGRNVSEAVLGRLIS